MHTTTFSPRVILLAAALALPSACSRDAAAGEEDSAPPSASVGAEQAAQGSLSVEVTGLRNADGAVHGYLYASADGFPNNFSKAVAHTKSGNISGSRASLDFAALAPGEYAVFVFHDENGDGKLDKNLIGLPQEGIGVSNLQLDKPKRPRWSAAKFEVRGPTTQGIALRYL
ncbi:MAG: DUF2141 domain-containing protein [Enhygromyxa sp.]